MKAISTLRILLGAATILGTATCTARDADGSVRVHQMAMPLRVTIVGDPYDPRVATIREALAHWNLEASRLALSLRLDSGTVIARPVPDDAMTQTSRAMPWGGVGVLRLRAACRGTL